MCPDMTQGMVWTPHVRMPLKKNVIQNFFQELFCAETPDVIFLYLTLEMVLKS